MELEDIAVVIPSLEPDEKLIALLAKINSHDEKFNIIIINDGSSSYYDPIFEQALLQENVTVLTHDINRGKGRALKTAFEYLMEHLPSIEAAITIDSDGQHTYEDMIKCLAVYHENSDSIIFGSRNFKSGENIPVRSMFGNRVTSSVLDSVIGNHYDDTQTGLRIIPSKYYTDFISIEGERFEYEMNMIIFAQLNNIEIIEVPIKTIYLDENESSHFNSITDSLLVYRVFINYFISFLIIFAIDIFTFYVFISNFSQLSILSIGISIILARIVSLVFKWLLNRFWVFKNYGTSNFRHQQKTILIRTLLSLVLVNLLYFTFESFNLVILKIIIDLLLILLPSLLKRR